MVFAGASGWGYAGVCSLLDAVAGSFLQIFTGIIYMPV